MECHLCGRDLTGEPFGAVWTKATGDRFYCHPDEGPDCYVEATVWGAARNAPEGDPR